jgi:VIT1/CCC1 family predicted Fe2+/Mn2+ transporter
MVDETISGNFEATLLEFGLISWAEDENTAIKSLIKQTHSHILMVIERHSFDGLIKGVDDHVMDDYWRHYRKIEFFLARSGRDLSHKLDSQIVQAIKEMLSEETKNIIREIAKDNAEKLVEFIDKIYTLNPSIFTYNEIKDAA